VGEPSHPVTQTFRDAALERAYLDHRAATALPVYRLVTFVTFFGVIGAYFADRAVFRTDGNLAVIHSIRLLVMFPGAALMIAFGFAPARWFRAGWRIAVVAGTVLVIDSPAMACALIPDPERFDMVVGYISVVAVMVAVGAALPIGFPHAAVCTFLVLVPMICLGVWWPNYDGSAPGWLGFAGAMGLFAAYQVNGADRQAFAATYRLDAERTRSERLLHNVLPAPVAERLKAGEARIADRFDDATVLFADLVGFTELAQRLSPESLVGALDEIFSAFDDIAARHGLEKIKTIGDAYMVVGGVPTRRADHAEAVAEMALEMRDVIASGRFGDGHQLALRIGLHSGPLVAGVIGKQKFIYDLWGDTVNTASRMESSGLASAIQVTAASEALLRDRFVLERRGPIAVKGKGELETWLLRERRERVSASA
jgi:class 3 adenylate cyclase